ncbi:MULTISPECIES: gliding motility protein GldL [unclassified Candidatus Cardinium]|uniref:type IX secretion system motor protein PorL/GldL n=1 Tax=unclassified Candidatus Cardinium TaxID=2641185 RepID=UPI001FB4C8EA|nr:MULTISPECIES: gliding motility protein GldL [unclassified Candidatus Cardinium]
MRHHLVNTKFKDKFYSDIMPFIYNIGAAIVIFGAMFKLLNLPGGNIMLGLGLSTEALIFLLGAFEPKEQAIDWSRVYPELAPNYRPTLPNNGPKISTITQKLDECLQKASIDHSLLENLALTMRRFSENMANVPSFANVSQVTEAYVHHVGQANQGIGDMAHALTSMNDLYKKALARMEEQATQTSMLYNHLETTLQAMEIAGKEAINFKQELSSLNEKITALNAIYAKTLTAFKS